MINLNEIHKPKTIAEAVRLMQQSDAALAVGTAMIVSQTGDVCAVVDLRALGLAYIGESNDAIAIGAMTTLAQVCASPVVRGFANGVIAQAAERAATSILRNQGTVGGTLIADPDSVFPAALLAVDAQATLVREETRNVLLAEILARRQQFLTKALLTEITLPLRKQQAALEIVARTPRDRPIVCVCASAWFENGLARDVRIAVAGVGEHAVRVAAAEHLLDDHVMRPESIELASSRAAEDMSPRGDFRASAEYRKAMISVLVQRALTRLT
jgi:aerobic carbon-monoxide dehydrogenase medium subunit